MRKLREAYYYIKGIIYKYIVDCNELYMIIFKRKPKIKKIDETIKYIVKNRCSVSRFGDGEIFLLNASGEIGFQPFNNDLALRLCEVLKSNVNNHIVCIPKVFGINDLSIRTDKSQCFWKNHLKLYRKVWYQSIDFNKQYFDANFTRNYIVLKDKSNSHIYFDSIKKIWSNRNILIVEGQYTRMGVGNDLFENSKSLRRILAPSENAYECYDKLLANIKEHYEEDDLVLIALGPTATVLAYDLSREGIQAIDIGHVDVEYEWFLCGAMEKIKIKTRYVNEIPEGRINIDIVKDKTYHNQIILDLSKGGLNSDK